MNKNEFTVKVIVKEARDLVLSEINSTELPNPFLIIKVNY